MVRRKRRGSPAPPRLPAANPYLGYVQALGSTDMEVVETAEDALAARGVDALAPLEACLESDDERARLRAISLLSLVVDPTASRRLAALLHDRSPAIRRRAAAGLARTPTTGSVAALTRAIERDDDLVVRVTATRSLVRLLQTGHEEALRPALALISDTTEDARVRLVALEAIGWLGDGDDERKSQQALLEKLSSDSNRRVALRAKRLLGTPPQPRLEAWAIDRLLRDLSAPRLAIWRRAVGLLTRGGGAIVEPLGQAMLAHADDAEFLRRAVLVLKALSARQLNKIGPYLEVVQAPTVLIALIEVVAASGSRPLLARVAQLIERLARRDDEQDAMIELRLHAHLALARSGSRLAADDLRRWLEDRKAPLPDRLGEAVALIGTRRELPALVRAYRRSRGVARLALREAMRSVARREKVRRTDRALALLEPNERIALLEIMGWPRGNGLSHHKQLGDARVDRSTDPLLT
jgi:HEAT repeat protein